MEGHRGDTQCLLGLHMHVHVGTHTKEEREERCSGPADTKETETKARRCYSISNTWKSISYPDRREQTKEPQAWLHRAHPGTQPGKPSRRTQESHHQGYALFSYWSSDMSEDTVCMHEHMTQNCKGVQVIQNHAMNRIT